MTGPSDSGKSDAPDMRHNVLKDRMASAATTAEGAATALAPSGGNPARSLLTKLQDAWQSPAPERTAYQQDVEGAGAAVKSAFTDQAAHARSEAGAQPRQVDEDNSSESWKAHGSQIDARASMPYGGGRY